MTPHIFVICWPAVKDNVLRICEALADTPGRKTVIDKTGTLPDPLPGWETLTINADRYYGMQMDLAFRAFAGDVLLAITGDVQSDDWAGLVRTCMARFETFPQIGIWSPEIDHTGWQTKRTAMGEILGSGLRIVAHTDAIVWAVRAELVERGRRLDYTVNNLGWGVDWALLAAAYTRNLLAVRDQAVAVHHPPGSAYSSDQALAQMKVFLKQLEPAETVMLAMLNRICNIREDARITLPTA